jgi:hypothetical protein
MVVCVNTKFWPFLVELVATYKRGGFQMSNELEGKYYDQFRWGYTGRAARRGYVWTEPGAPIVPYSAAYENGRYHENWNLHLRGDELRTQEKYLCEATLPSGYKTYILDTSGDRKETGNRGIEPALCYKFADMSPTEKRFQEFANDWGLLETKTKIAPPDWKLPEGRKDVRFDGSVSVNGQVLRGFTLGDFWPSAISLSDLMKAHRELRFASVLWRLLEYENTMRLSDVFYIGKLDGREDGLICRFTDSRELNGEEGIGSDTVYDIKWISKARKEEMIISAYSEMFSYVESGDVTVMTMLTLSKLLNRNLPQRVDTRCILRRDIRALLPATRATSLLGALWLQLFMAVCGERPLRRCTICGEWDLKKELRQGKYHRKCWDREYRKEKRIKTG